MDDFTLYAIGVLCLVIWVLCALDKWDMHARRKRQAKRQRLSDWWANTIYGYKRGRL